MINPEQIQNPEAKRFFIAFLRDRNITLEFYRLLSEDKFDYRMVNNESKKSDSPRESLVHLVDVTRDYVRGIRNGRIALNSRYEDLIDNEKFPKVELIQKLEEGTQELFDLLIQEDINLKKIEVPWSKSPVLALTAIWGLDEHEILHTGWNLALMDLLNIQRFPALRKKWG